MKKELFDLSFEQFNQMQTELELLRMLSESEHDVANDNVAPIKNTFDDIRKKLNL